MSDDEPTTSPSSSQPSVAAWLRQRLGRLEMIAILLSVLLAASLVVLALDMKFEADQARWQQRQTCLEWYRLQADYKVGPWYQKLPDAAADCGGGVDNDGNPVVPGGKASAVEPGEDRYVPRE
jgi:hypothetical protein